MILKTNKNHCQGNGYESSHLLKTFDLMGITGTYNKPHIFNEMIKNWIFSKENPIFYVMHL